MHNVNRLIELLVIAKSFDLKTAMYTGLEHLESELLAMLDYYKLGKYDKNLGGLSSPITNQKLYKSLNNKTLFYDFKSKNWRQI